MLLVIAFYQKYDIKKASVIEALRTLVIYNTVLNKFRLELATSDNNVARNIFLTLA